MLTGSARADNPAEVFELPRVEVIGTTPLPGLGSALSDVPANVQVFGNREFSRQRSLDLTGFLDRNANRDVALTWKEAVYKPGTVKILPCELRDLEQSWEYFRRADLHKLSAVDATSFAIMKRARIHLAFTFDHRFTVVGFRLVT